MMVIRKAIRMAFVAVLFVGGIWILYQKMWVLSSPETIGGADGPTAIFLACSEDNPCIFIAFGLLTLLGAGVLLRMRSRLRQLNEKQRQIKL